MRNTIRGAILIIAVTGLTLYGLHHGYSVQDITVLAGIPTGAAGLLWLTRRNNGDTV